MASLLQFYATVFIVARAIRELHFCERHYLPWQLNMRDITILLLLLLLPARKLYDYYLGWVSYPLL